MALGLSDRYRVVTFDPRGNSRSPLDAGPEDQQVEMHADDALRLIERLADGPALVFGSSSGALVALDLLPDPSACVRRTVGRAARRSGPVASEVPSTRGGHEGVTRPPAPPTPPDEEAALGGLYASLYMARASGLA